MRIVFIGNVLFSAAMLRHLVNLNANVVGICTSKNSTINKDHIDLATLREASQIPYIHTNDINSSRSVDWIKYHQPDIIFCFGWSQLIKSALLEVPRLGVVGFHPAYLPSNRGRHPIIWALVLGLNETAATFFIMDETADGGDILSQTKIEISEEEDAEDLYNKITVAAKSQLNEIIPLLISEDFERIPQTESQANNWRKRKHADGLIDWRMPSRGIYNLIRGLARPYVGASFLLGGQEIKVWKSEIYPWKKENLEPGKVVKITSAGPVVKCGEGALCLLEVEPVFDFYLGMYL